MSRIITNFKCDHCGKEYNTYISFGHPDNDFVWKWKCDKCNKVNKYLVEAMPHDSLYYDIPYGRKINWLEHLAKLCKLR